MTSNASAETALQAVRQGAYDYLKKPFVLPEVWTTVQRAIEQRSPVAEEPRRARPSRRSAIESSRPPWSLDRRRRRRRRRSWRRRVRSSTTSSASSPRSSTSIAPASCCSTETGERATDRRSPRDGRWPGPTSTSVRVGPGEGVSGFVAETGEPFLVSDTDANVRTEPDDQLASSRSRRTRSCPSRSRWRCRSSSAAEGARRGQRDRIAGRASR